MAEPEQLLPDEVWDEATDESVPPGVVVIDGQPFPLIEFMEDIQPPD